MRGCFSPFITLIDIFFYFTSLYLKSRFKFLSRLELCESSLMPTIQVPIPESDAPFLGGLAGKGKHPIDTTYSKLFRSRELPPFVTKSFKDNATDPRIKTIFEALSSGHDLSIVWSFPEQGTLILKAFYSGDGHVLSEPIHSVVFNTLMGFVYVFSTMWKPLEDTLNQDDRNALNQRLLHLFLRTEGSRLDWNMVSSLCMNLTRYYAPQMKTKGGSSSSTYA